MVPVSNAGSYAQAPAGPAPADTDSSYVPAPSAQAVEQQYPENQYNADNGYGQQAETYAEQPPPELPDYEQPSCPGDGYIWTPGYWNYATAGYYWVPGAWVMAPYTGALWTPGYWGWASNRYAYYPGYWGRHVGYYGGVNYGYGYLGSGYQGGYWHGNQFAYNRTVNNINTRVVRNVYDYHVANVSRSRVSYNGGRGGLQYRPHPTELVAMHEQHNPPMAAQTQMARTAQANRNNFAHVNNGRPATAAVSHPVPADRNVRPPAAVRYAPVQKPVQTRPAEQQRPGQPQQGRPVQTQRPEARPGQPQRPAAARGTGSPAGRESPSTAAGTTSGTASSTTTSTTPDPAAAGASDAATPGADSPGTAASGATSGAASGTAPAGTTSCSAASGGSSGSTTACCAPRTGAQAGTGATSGRAPAVKQSTQKETGACCNHTRSRLPFVIARKNYSACCTRIATRFRTQRAGCFSPVATSWKGPESAIGLPSTVSATITVPSWMNGVTSAIE